MFFLFFFFFLWALIFLPSCNSSIGFKPWNKTIQAYSASVTGVPRLSPLISKATSIYPDGHVCQLSAIEGENLAWTAIVEWISLKLLFLATVQGCAHASENCNDLFLLLLGSEFRVGWQEGRMCSHSFSMLWAHQSTPSQCIDHLQLVFFKSYSLQLWEVSGAFSSLWAPDPKKDALNLCLENIKSWPTGFDQCLINCKSSLRNETFSLHAVFLQSLT